MGERSKFWAAHVEALQVSGLTSKAYAEQHGVSLHSLRSWTSRLRAESRTVPAVSSFVALELDAGASCATAACGCTLRGPGWALEMASLPPPHWLADLAAAMRVVR